MYWAAPATGSPPRMRGKGTVVSFISANPGITPAYAGKRAGSSGNYSTAGDHPRVCGEKCTACGVSPITVGITPAYAGKRDIPPQDSPPLGDHPRVCGEKLLNLFLSFIRQGSPPRMRGKADPADQRTDQPGITPAYAGKSAARSFEQQTQRDHPRVCGEKTKKIP